MFPALSVRPLFTRWLTPLFALALAGAATAAPLDLPPTMTPPPADWTVSALTPGKREATVEVTQDALLGGPVVEVARGTTVTYRTVAVMKPPYSVQMRVRLTDAGAKRPFGHVKATTGGATVNGEWAPGYSLSLLPARGTLGEYMARATIGEDTPAQHEPVPEGWRASPWAASVQVAPRFTPADISPLMPETMRRELERDVAALPVTADRWLSVRVDVLSTSIRMYVDDLLVLEDDHRAPAAGQVELQLSQSVNFGGATVRPATDAEADAAAGYVTAPLGWILNAGAAGRLPTLARGASLAATPTRVSAGPVPFELTTRGAMDHVDVGASLFRYRLSAGYRPAAEPRDTVPPAEKWDPARLSLRVPARVYRRAWVLAASLDDPAKAPVLSLRFYKPGAGWWLDATESAVPLATATSGPDGARQVTVTGADGKSQQLWAIPIELDAAALASDFREEEVYHVEVTKAIHDFRAWPDPAGYGAYQGGPPSAVQLYGLTFEEAPLDAYGTGLVHGNTHTYPEQPGWQVRLWNQRAVPVDAEVAIRVTPPTVAGRPADAPIDLARSVSLPAAPSGPLPAAAIEPAAGLTTLRFSLPALPVFGLYDVATTIRSGDFTQTRHNTLLYLPPDQRRVIGTKSPFGIWNWGGGHGTHSDPDDNMRLLRAIGATMGSRFEGKERKHWGLGPDELRTVQRSVPAWAFEESPDPAVVEAYLADLEDKAKERLKVNPDLLVFSSLAENSVSLRLTHGVPSYAFGEPWFTYDDKEADRIKGYWTAVAAAAKRLKASFPKVHFIFGHCAPAFYLPFFRDPAFDPSIIDGFGIDSPQFERMPERQPRATEPSLMYFLNAEMKERGMAGKEVVHLESFYPSSHPLALGGQGAADSTVRTAVLAFSWGTTMFMASWTLHDCADYWGSQHYGCSGFYARRPEYDPKPAAAAFAAMTAALDGLSYDGWTETGSRSAFCVGFKSTVRNDNRRAYALWTLRGTRPLTLQLDPKTPRVQLVDGNGNATDLVPVPGATPADPATVTVTLGASPQWLLLPAGNGVLSAAVGTPDHGDSLAPAGTERLVLEDFESRDWTVAEGEYPLFAENHWDVVRRRGDYTLARVDAADGATGKVLQTALQNAPDTTPMVGYYSLLTPPAAMPIPGQAAALTIRARGNSAWNRVVFLLEDAQGETWFNAGNKDAWNCDDIHSWSYLNFDGWRTLRVPLPGNATGDDYRQKDNVWWGSDGDHIVDLPLKVKGLLVVTRTHQVYADAMLPVTDLSMQLDDLALEYASPADRADGPAARQARDRAAYIASLPSSADLPNPIAARLADPKAAAPAPTLLDLYPPAEMRDGSRAIVAIAPVEGAKEFQVWISAYADGRGAQVQKLRPLADKPSDFEIRGLQPAVPLYFFITYTAADGSASKPSTARRAVLKDEFPMK